MRVGVHTVKHSKAPRSIVKFIRFVFANIPTLKSAMLSLPLTYVQLGLLMNVEWPATECNTVYGWFCITYGGSKTKIIFRQMHMQQNTTGETHRDETYNLFLHPTTADQQLNTRNNRWQQKSTLAHTVLYNCIRACVHKWKCSDICCEGSARNQVIVKIRLSLWIKKE